MALDTRNSIITVASRLFCKFGFHKTSMDEVAKTARKAKGSLYYHFVSKEALFKEVVSTEMEAIKTELQKISSDPSLEPIDKLKKYLIVRMEQFSVASNYHETLKADLYEHFEFLDNLRNELTEWEKTQIRQIMQEALDKGLVINSFDLDVGIDIFMMVLRGLEVPFFVQGNYARFAPHFDQLINVLAKGISA